MVSNRFELVSKRFIPSKAEKVKLPQVTSNSAAEEIEAPDFERKLNLKSSKPLTIYIIPSFSKCNKPATEEDYSLRLDLLYSYDCDNILLNLESILRLKIT